jgi:hypothetical protein
MPYSASAEGGDIRTFGDPGGTSFRFVDHGKTVSIYAVRVPADFILDELKAVGGPTYRSMEPLTRPVTLTLHDVPIETMMRQMLDGYNYTLLYEDGRLSQVRVMHMIPGRSYKVFDPVETLSEWTRRETHLPADAPVATQDAPQEHRDRERHKRRRDLEGAPVPHDRRDSAPVQ